MRESEFKVTVIKYLSDGTPVVVYEAIEPAEIYTVPNGFDDNGNLVHYYIS